MLPKTLVKMKVEGKFACVASRESVLCQESFACFNITHICVYELDKYGNLFPCGGGELLQLCTTFECNSMFKCPGYYCTFWRYVCDDRWDCPSGYDELNCEYQNCSGMFKCKDSSVCIHHEDVCNQVADCPSDDDEILCSLHQIDLSRTLSVSGSCCFL